MVHQSGQLSMNADQPNNKKSNSEIVTQLEMFQIIEQEGEVITALGRTIVGKYETKEEAVKAIEVAPWDLIIAVIVAMIEMKPDIDNILNAKKEQKLKK